MPEHLVSYDLKETSPRPHKEFALAAEKEGLLYVDYTTSDLRRLPNTTLWGDFTDSAALVVAFDRAKAAAEKKLNIKIVVEKRVVTRYSDARINSDKAKVAEAKWKKSSNFETCRAHQLNDPFFAY